MTAPPWTKVRGAIVAVAGIIGVGQQQLRLPSPPTTVLSTSSPPALPAPSLLSCSVYSGCKLLVMTLSSIVGSIKSLLFSLLPLSSIPSILFLLLFPLLCYKRSTNKQPFKFYAVPALFVFVRSTHFCFMLFLLGFFLVISFFLDQLGKMGNKILGTNPFFSGEEMSAA